MRLTIGTLVFLSSKREKLQAKLEKARTPAYRQRVQDALGKIDARLRSEIRALNAELSSTRYQ